MPVNQLIYWALFLPDTCHYGKATHVFQLSAAQGSGPWCAHGGGLGPGMSQGRSGGQGPTGPWLLHQELGAAGGHSASLRRHLPFRLAAV
jgi:hypothetical protein